MINLKPLILPLMALCSASSVSGKDFVFIDNGGYQIPISLNASFTPIDPKYFPEQKYLQLYSSFSNPEHKNARTTGDVARRQAAQLLGNGYDQITGETKANDCWVGSDKLQLIETEALVNETPYKNVEVIKSYDSLVTYFKDDRDSSYTIGDSKKKFYLNASKDNKQVVQNTSRIHEHGVVAFRMRHKHRRYTAPSVANLAMDGQRINELVTDQQPAGKNQFRAMCGDKYLSSVTSGRELEGTVRIHRHKESYSENTDIENDMKLGIDKLFTLTKFSQIQDSDFVKKHMDMEFQLAYSRIGGRSLDALKNMTITIKDAVTGEEKDVPLLSGNVDTVVELAALIVAFNQRYDDDETLGLVSSQRQDYPIPQSLIAKNKSHFDVFPDYKIPLRKHNSWALFAGQVAQRCDIYNEDRGTQAADLQHAGIHQEYYRAYARPKMINGLRYQQYDLCGSVERIITDYQDRCSDANTWADPNIAQQCHYPKGKQCTDKANPGESCLLRANALDKWKLVKDGFILHVALGHGLNKKSKSGSQNFCYQNKDILADYRRSYSTDFVSAARTPGATIKIRQKVRLVNDAKTIVSHKDGEQACMSHSATIERIGWHKSGAIYEAEALLHGYKPEAGFA